MHLAQPFIEKEVHPTVVVRGYMKALQDAVKILDEIAFPIDVDDSKLLTHTPLARTYCDFGVWILIVPISQFSVFYLCTVYHLRKGFVMHTRALTFRARCSVSCKSVVRG